ncbi:M20 family metallopeptidase [soil metagenome]
MSDAIQIPDTLCDDLHTLYRHLHAHPELSMAEHETAALIDQRMNALGFTTTPCAGTGLVATLSNGPGPVIAFRADIDALPLAEQSGLDYASTARSTLPDGSDVPVMHACGHDTHITCAIGAAHLLATGRDAWSGTVIFLFQPAEETAVGAAAMVADGVWDKALPDGRRPEVVYSQHVWPGRAGTVEITPGAAMAMADSWKVTVHGRGGHGSRPEGTIDPVVLAAYMIVRIQGIVARELAAQSAAVITIATIHAGLKENIIPPTAEFTINVRNLDDGVRDTVLAALRRVILAEAQASAAPEPSIEELYTFPLLVNDEALTAEAMTVLAAELGEHQVGTMPPSMGSEDFGHLPQAIDVPGVYWFFGGTPDALFDSGEPVPFNHSPFFAPVIEPTLSTGVRAAYAMLRHRLQRPDSPPVSE